MKSNDSPLAGYALQDCGKRGSRLVKSSCSCGRKNNLRCKDKLYGRCCKATGQVCVPHKAKPLHIKTVLGSAQEAEKEAEKEDHIEDDVDMGFGDMDEEEKEAGGGEEEAEDAADFAVLGEEHDDDDREAAKSEPVELEVAEKLDIDETRAEQESASRRIGGTIPHRSYASREGEKKIEKADGGRQTSVLHS